MKALVTGGAGFIGSHLVDRLIDDGYDVTVLDNLSSGKLEFLEPLDRMEFIEADLMDAGELDQHVRGKDIVFHIAANPDVRLGSDDTKVHIEQNLIATHNLLESMRRTGVELIAFTSTSTVYGNASIIPTPEDYGPLKPISLYGASKLAAEAIISAYCDNFDMKAVMWRFANVVGPRSTHGVTYDFVHKLRADSETMEILGDGKQLKSYFYISDCIDGMMHSLDNRQADCDIYNIGSLDYIDVNALADIVSDEMGLASVNYTYTGGVKGGAGWKGDVKVMRLSVDYLADLGWKPQYDSSMAIRLTARHLIGEL